MKKQKFGFTGKSKQLQSISVAIGQWWYIFIAAAGSSIVSIAASFAGTYKMADEWAKIQNVSDGALFFISNPWLFIVIGAVSIIYGGRGTYIDQFNLSHENKKLVKENLEVEKYKKNINDLTEDSESLQNELYDLQVKLVTTWLKGSSRQLNLSTNERVTIYYYVDGYFYLLARHSQNPKLSEIHRQKFPRNEGVISKAWEHKICVDTENIPDYKSDPVEYSKYMNEKYCYSEEKTHSLTMKTRQYVAISIIEADNNIGVIVFESLDGNKFKPQKIAQMKKYCETYQSYMVDFIKGGTKYDRSARMGLNEQRNADKEFLLFFKKEEG